VCVFISKSEIVDKLTLAYISHNRMIERSMHRTSILLGFAVGCEFVDCCQIYSV